MSIGLTVLLIVLCVYLLLVVLFVPVNEPWYNESRHNSRMIRTSGGGV